MDLEKKEQIEARLRDLMKEHHVDTKKVEKQPIKQTSGNVIRRRKGQPIKRIV